MAVRQTACRHCGQDIENFSPYRKGEWRDRGNNSRCPNAAGDAGQLHAPVTRKLESRALGESEDVRQARALLNSRPVHMETRDVLAACYLVGQNKSRGRMLTHAAVVDADSEVLAVICGRVSDLSLADAYASHSLTAPPSCDYCQRILRNFTKKAGHRR